jgi:hypothetical protein
MRSLLPVLFAFTAMLVPLSASAQSGPLTFDEVMGEIGRAERALEDANKYESSMDGRLDVVLFKLRGDDPAQIWFKYQCCRDAVTQAGVLCRESQDSIVAATLWLNMGYLGHASMCAEIAYGEANMAASMAGSQGNDISDLEVYVKDR